MLNNFKQVLNSQGIKVGVTSVNNQPLPQGNITEVATILSPPIANLIKETNLNSNNLFAEVLLRQLSNLDPTSDRDSLTGGLGRINQQLTSLGVNSDGYRLADGSGLSRHNLITPKTLVQVLQGMVNHPQSQVYRDSLPLAGVSGSLKNRFINTVSSGRVAAKTGTMSGVVSLAGYLNPIDYQPLSFSIIVNNSNVPASTMRTAIDQIVIKLTQLKEC
jgi:D-alanyl-D-alanine carboxypeptidase/D-alanyl-D-alanine-endopeptidase (penicillin-binding protein 4)